MSWEPKYQARFEGPLIDNILALVTRDMKFALDYFFPAENLPDFVERSLGTEKGLEFPILVIGPRTNPIESSADRARLIEAPTVEIQIGVIAESADKAMQLIQKYVLALDHVLRAGSFADYTSGLSSQGTFGFQVNVSHEYGGLRTTPERSSYFKSARLDASIQFNEA